MVGVPMLKAERISRSGPKLSDAQTRNFEAIKYSGRVPDDATVDVLARRIAGGGGGAGGADLSIYDGFLKGAVADGS